MISATIKQLTAASLLLALAIVTPSRAEVTIEALEIHTNEFAEMDWQRNFRVVSSEPLRARFAWHVSVLNRTVASGERELRWTAAETSAAESTNAESTVAVNVRLNRLRNEVIMPATLTAAVVVDQQEVARTQSQLWLFPKDPFERRGEWLRSLRVTLFDPDQRSQRVFDQSTIPHQNVRNAAALDSSASDGTLVIGEGISLRKRRSLAQTALLAAANGQRVILLAPADGSLTIPAEGVMRVDESGTGSSKEILHEIAGVPSELRFSREPTITSFDKRLDASAWFGTNQSIPATRFLLESDRGRVAARVSEQSIAWPWLELRFPKNDGRLLVCGFRIIEHWDKNPTPRYLLLRILESMSDSSTAAPTQTQDNPN